AHLLLVRAVLPHGRGCRRFRHEGELEIEPRQHRSEIMRNSREHGGALLDIALDTGLHHDEGVRGFLDLARTGWAEIGNVAPHPECLRRLRQPEYRPDLSA